MEKINVLKKLENRKKMFEEYLRQIKTPAEMVVRRGSSAIGTNGRKHK